MSLQDPPEKETLNLHPFDEQAFLMFNIRKLAHIHNSEHVYIQKVYEKVDMLKGKNVALLNRLLNSDFFKKEALLDITPAQISELVPQIRLYKQYFKTNHDLEKEVEFKFQTYLGSNPGDILEDIGRSSYGIQSFEIESQGTTFFTADKQFTAKMVLYFQSFDELTLERYSGKEKYRFLDLIVQPPVESKDVPAVSTQAPPPSKNLRDIFVDPNAFRIRADIGWSAAPITNSSAFNSPQGKAILDALKYSNISFFLYCTQHEININENGTLTLNLDFVGAFDFAQRDVRAGIILSSEKKKALDSLSQRLKKAVEAKDQKAIERERTTLVNTQTTLSKEAFESIVKEMMEGDKQSSSSFQATTINSKIYQTAISRRAASQFSKYAVGENIPPVIFKNVETTYDIADVAGQRRAPAVDKTETVTVKTAKIDFCNINWYPKQKIESGVTYTVFDPIQIAPFENIKIEQIIKHPIITDDEGQEYININWFYFGDLMEILMKRAFNTNIADTEDLTRRFGTEYSKRVKLILSDVNLTDFCTGETIRVNLAHVPISLKKFTVFFYNKVINTRNLNYTIDDFIKDFLNDLVKDMFLDRSYIVGRKLKQNITLKYLNLGVFSEEKGVDPLKPIDEFQGGLGDVVEVGSVNADKFLRSSTIERRPENYFFYLMIYQDIFDPSVLTGDYKKDREIGIPHVYLGKDRGIVKSVSFKKSPLAYQKEQRIAEEGKIFDPIVILASLYNVDIQAYGNTLFLLGTYLYLLPTGMGSKFGLPNQAGTLANLMGLGGYYFINKVTWDVSSGKYLTTINARFEATGDRNTTANKELYPRGAGMAITDRGMAVVLLPNVITA